MDIFESCRVVNEFLSEGKEQSARNELIKLLAEIDDAEAAEYTPLLNRLIREVGLFPYIDVDTSGWQERFIREIFKTDVGEAQPVTLHREQSRLLNTLLSGRSVAVSAPTSFGKSFVIDAFIALRNPANVVILVPTIALADETRRRLQRKFGERYKIITTADQTLAADNIFIFPQERAIGYAGQISQIDILVVDEFYKASKEFDKERAPSLIRSIVEFSRITKQRYFLAPNINNLTENAFTEGMDFVKLDFNTVFLEKNELYHEIGKDEGKKNSALLEILDRNDGKTLIYAGTYANIRKISNLLIQERSSSSARLLVQFQSWLSEHYERNWDLTSLVVKGVGIHNGQLHRSLSQIQIKLFEEEDGLQHVISTSSIIEGVNTSAKNVVLWSNKNGSVKLNDFTYKNIIGRGGRMFRHFIGKIFILEKPPSEEHTQLELEYPDELLGFMEEERPGIEYTPEQVAKIRAYESDMRKLIGSENLAYLQSSGVLQSSDKDLILAIARNIHSNPSAWNGLRHLNSHNVEAWDRLLYQIIRLQPSGWDIVYGKYVAFVKVLANNWRRTIPELLDELSVHDIGIDDFFKLERNTTFRLATLLGDVQTIYNAIHQSDPIELAPAISRFSHAFLPVVVFQLEEYGLPRMISRKICAGGAIDLEAVNDIHEAISIFQRLGFEGTLNLLPNLDEFDIYILRYFFDGLSAPALEDAALTQ